MPDMSNMEKWWERDYKFPQADMQKWLKDYFKMDSTVESVDDNSSREIKAHLKGRIEGSAASLAIECSIAAGHIAVFIRGITQDDFESACRRLHESLGEGEMHKEYRGEGEGEGRLGFSIGNFEKMTKI